ncbi:MAG: hypothetical protein KAJ21_01900 [Thermoplasmatales archaeon]|nr:hypothetical protein [Thermoplasmatales archaeon]
MKVKKPIISPIFCIITVFPTLKDVAKIPINVIIDKIIVIIAIYIVLSTSVLSIAAIILFESVPLLIDVSIKPISICDFKPKNSPLILYHGPIKPMIKKIIAK